jgi:8-oxo-dGTP diphosphatase
VSDESRILPGAGVAVLDDEGRLLLARRRIDGRWGCPGGRVEPGESWAECARREFREETGAEVDLTGLLGVYSNPADQAPAADGERVQVIGVVFEGRIVGSLGESAPDVTDVGWFGAGELPAPLWEPDVPVIRDALSASPRPFIR